MPARLTLSYLVAIVLLLLSRAAGSPISVLWDAAIICKTSWFVLRHLLARVTAVVSQHVPMVPMAWPVVHAPDQTLSSACSHSSCLTAVMPQ